MQRRARLHQALGDEHRLAIVDALRLSDLTPSELLKVSALTSNLLAFHLDALEAAGLISRQVSQGDRRRRYVTLHDDVLGEIEAPPGPSLELGEDPVLFVCSRNSARSQLAAALWTTRTGRDALSAGADPAPEVHRHAVAVAQRHDLDLTHARPRGYDAVTGSPGLVVSVCDRARETGLPFDTPALHWSVPAPSGGAAAFEDVFTQLERRVDRFAAAVGA